MLQFFTDNPVEGAPKTDFSGDFWFDRYMERVILSPDVQSLDGVFQPKAFELIESQFRALVGEDTFAYVKARLKVGRHFPPIVQELQKVQTDLKAYWTLHDRIFVKGSADHTAVDNYYSLDQRTQNDLTRTNARLRGLIARVQRGRDAFRRRNPELDWALVQFYDNVPRTNFAANQLTAWRASQQLAQLGFDQRIRA